MLKRARGELVEELGQGRHLLAAADQRAAYLLEGELRDRALAVGDPVEDAVVEGEQHAVGGDVDVGLEVVVAQRHRVLERRQGVLEALDLGVVGAAAVGEREHAAGRRPLVGRPAASAVTLCSMYPARVPGEGPRPRATVGVWIRWSLPGVRHRDGHPAARRRRGERLPGRPRRLPAPRRPRQPGRGRADWHRHAGQHTMPMPRITADMAAPPWGSRRASVGRDPLRLIHPRAASEPSASARERRAMVAGERSERCARRARAPRSVRRPRWTAKLASAASVRRGCRPKLSGV